MRYEMTGILCLLAFLPMAAFSQAPDSAAKLSAIPEKEASGYISAVSAKSDKISGDIDKQTAAYLAKLQKQETRIRKKLSKIDSAAADNIFTDSEKKYKQLQTDIQNRAQRILKGNGRYVPWLDSSSTALKFLQGNAVTGKLTAGASQAKAALAKVRALSDEFNKAENVQDFIRQRKEYLKQRLASYDLGSELKNYNQTAYYYSQQINECRAAMNDPDRAMSRAMALLDRLPAFQDFMKKNSMLAGLFNIPSDYGTSSIGGLQAKDQIAQMISDRMQMMGPAKQAAAQQNMSAAQSELSSLRSKIQQTGSGGEMPDFKPNQQKTKTFLQRLEYGANMQTSRGSYGLPAATDFALTAGYKLSDNNSIGLGASYRMGWGAPIKDVHFSSQGIGLRSYFEARIKKDFFATGGYELNYQPAISSFPQTGLSSWQKSGLVGISKAVPIKSQFFRNTKLQLLWDFLSYSQVPRGKPFVFRVGYSF